MRALHPISEGRVAGIPPKAGFQPHCRQLRLPGGKGSAQPCWKPRKHPLPSKEARQYDSKELFHSGKRKAHVKRKSEGHRHRQLVRGGERGDPGSTHLQPRQHLLLTPGTQCAPRSLPLPKSPAASPPSTGTHCLLHGKAHPSPPH